MGNRYWVVLLVCLLLLCVLLGVVFAADFREDGDWKEIGAIWQNSYGGDATPYPCHFSSLNYTDDFCAGLKDVLKVRGGWHEHSAVWRGDGAQAFEVEDSGNDKADMVDLFVWSGHGPSRQDYWPDGGVLHFRTNHSQNTASDYCNASSDAGNVEHHECRWGQGDCEFVILFTCNFLNDFNSSDILGQMREMCQGLHVVCGFACIMEIKFAQGRTLGELLMGKAGWSSSKKDAPRKVVDAWFESCQKHQDAGKVAVALYHWDCRNDYLPGNIGWASGLGMVADPPPCNSSNYGSYIRDILVIR